MSDGRPTGVPARGLLLMTATVAPSMGVPDLSRRSESDRRQDYLEAVAHYARRLNPTSTRIVLAENSGADLADFAGAARHYGHDLLTVHVPPAAAVSERGKGNGEAHLIDHALANIPELEGYTYLAKVTGRVRIKNVVQLLAPAEGQYIGCRVRQDLDRIDSRFVIADVQSAIRLYSGLEPLIDESRRVFFEHAALFRLMELTFLKRSRWVRLARYPEYVGVSGTAGSNYGGLSERVTWPVKSLLHRLPWVDYR